MLLELILATLSSGILATLITIKATRKKASAEARGVEIDNAQKLLDNFDTYIVEPLKQQVNELKKDFQVLQSAIAEISRCPLRDDCPVIDHLDRLRDNAEGKQSEKLPPPADPDPI